MGLVSAARAARKFFLPAVLVGVTSPSANVLRLEFNEPTGVSTDAPTTLAAITVLATKARLAALPLSWVNFSPTEIDVTFSGAVATVVGVTFDGADPGLLHGGVSFAIV
jgi:hypothetical protein